METQTVTLAPQSIADIRGELVPLVLGVQWCFVALCAVVFFVALGALQRWKEGK